MRKTWPISFMTPLWLSTEVPEQLSTDRSMTGPDVSLQASPRGLTGLAVFWQKANRCNVHITLSNIGQFSNFKNESPSVFSDSNNETLIFLKYFTIAIILFQSQLYKTQSIKLITQSIKLMGGGQGSHGWG